MAGNPHVVIGQALTDYAKSCEKFVQYPHEVALVYPCIGVADEAAELLEKACARPMEYSHAAILGEVGDVLFYAGQAAAAAGRTLGGLYLDAMALDWRVEATLSGNAIAIASAAGKILGGAKKILRGDASAYSKAEEKVVAYLPSVIRGLDVIASNCGSSIVKVSNLNFHKLDDRLARDVIKGEGDNR